MRKINTAALAAALSNAAPVDNPAAIEERINPYLLEKVIMPFLCGKDIMLADIDFSEFDPEDVDDAKDVLDDEYDSVNGAIRIAHTFRSIEPLAVKIKSFC